MADTRIGIKLDVQDGGLKALLSQLKAFTSESTKATAQSIANSNKETDVYIGNSNKVSNHTTQVTKYLLGLKQRYYSQVQKEEDLAARKSEQSAKKAADEAASHGERVQKYLQSLRQRSLAQAQKDEAKLAEEHRKAGLIQSNQARSFAQLEAQYSKVKTRDLVSDIEKLVRVKKQAETDMLNASTKAGQEEAARKKAVAQSELNSLNILARERPGVSQGGMGKSVGIMGIGREYLQGAVGNMAGMAGPLAGAMAPVMDVIGKIGPAGMIAAGSLAAIGATMKATVGPAMEYEDALADLRAITGLSKEETAGLGEDARKLGVDFGVAATEVVETSKLIVSALGPEIAKNAPLMKQVTLDVMNLGKASNISSQEASAAITGTLGQFGLVASESTRVANVFAAAAQAGNAEVNDLKESFVNVGPVAKNAGLSVETTAAALETLGKMNIKGAEAGTAFRGFLNKISAGGDEATEALGKLGLTYADINPEKVGLTKSITTLRDSFAKIKDPVEKNAIQMKVFDTYTKNAAIALMDNVGVLTEYETKVTDTNAAEEQAAIKKATLSERIARLTQGFKDFGLSIGNFFIPIINGVMDVVGGVISVFSKLWEWTGALIGKFVDWVASWGWVQAIMWKVKTTISEVVDWVMKAYRTVADFINGVVGVVDTILGTGTKKVKVEVQTTGPNPVAPNAPGGASEGGDSALSEKERKKQEREAKRREAAARKAAKSAYDAEREETEIFYKDLQTAIELKVANGVYTEEQGKLLTLRNTAAMNNSLMAVAKSHNKTFADFELKHAQALAQIRKDFNDKQEKEAKEAEEKEKKRKEEEHKKAIAQIELDSESEQFVEDQKLALGQTSEIQHAQRIYEIKRKALDEQLALEKVGSEKYLALQADTKKLDAQNALDNAKALADIAKDNEKKKADFIKDGADFTRSILQADHAERGKMITDFLANELYEFGVQQLTKLALKTSSEAGQTAVQEAGAATRSGLSLAEMGSNLLSAASSVATAIANAVRWVFTTIPFPFSLGVAGAAVGAIYGLWKGAESMLGFSSGGYTGDDGPGTETSDSIPARLSKKEFVLRASAVKSIGVDTLNYMNATGEIPGFKDGGSPGDILTAESLHLIAGIDDGLTGGKGSLEDILRSYSLHLIAGIDDGVTAPNDPLNSSFVPTSWSHVDQGLRERPVFNTSPFGLTRPNVSRAGSDGAMLAELRSLRSDVRSIQLNAILDQNQNNLSGEQSRFIRKEKTY